MICDKCGFEHNNKSACPKCGARVIFVNEDYLKRRQEWEEAQKNGKAGMLPPGIMHSTKEEHDSRKGKDVVTHIKQEGGSEKTSLPFLALKDKFIKFIARVIVNRKRKTPTQKPKKNNAKKRRYSPYKKKPLLILAAVVILLAVCIPILVHNLNKKDASRVFSFDGKQGVYLNDSDNIVLGVESGSSILNVTDTSFIEMDDYGMSLFNAGRTNRIEVKKSSVIASNDSLSAILYESGDSYYFYNSETNPVDITSSDLAYSGCAVSDNGSFYVITTIKDGGDDSTYTLYYGNEEGCVKAESNELQKNVITLTDEGTLLFLDMESAEYGIVNDKNLVQYDGTSLKTVAENITDYTLIGDVLYYIDSDGKLYGYSDGTATYIDNEVENFCTNEMNSKQLYYSKADGCYRMEKDSDYRTPLVYTDTTDITLYYNEKNSYLYYSDSSAVYLVAKVGNNVSPTRIAGLKYGTEPAIVSDRLIFISDTGVLYSLDKSMNEIDENVSGLMTIENYKGYSYVKDNKRYIVNKNGEKVISFTAEGLNLSGNQLIYSNGNFYYRDSDNILAKINKKSGKTQIIGTSLFCIVVN